jgi:hypothetical protein
MSEKNNPNNFTKELVKIAVDNLQIFAEECDNETLYECMSLFYTGLAIIHKYEKSIPGPQGPQGPIGPTGSCGPMGPSGMYEPDIVMCPVCYVQTGNLLKHSLFESDADHAVLAVFIS